MEYRTQVQQTISKQLECIGTRETTIDEDGEDQLYHLMKDLPDFLSYPLPARWFKKYNIAPLEPTNVKDYIHSNYAFKCMFAPKDLDPIIIDKPQTDLSGNIKLVKMIEPEKIEVEVVSKSWCQSTHNSNASDQSSQSGEVHLDQGQQEKEKQH